MNILDQQKFWDNKILNWEKARYSRGRGEIHDRITTAYSLVSGMSSPLRILELGCGSGRFAHMLQNKPEIEYVGVDFSSVAIRKAEERALPKEYRFFCQSIEDVDFKGFDLVISLGLLDWLTDEQVSKIGKESQSPFFIHSYSSKDWNPIKFLHSCFVSITYGYKSSGYVPKYRSEAEVARLLDVRKYKLYKKNLLSLSRIMSNCESDEL